MDLRSYQRAALKTLQPTPEGADPHILPLLGLAGEAGGVATLYKKVLRDGAAYQGGKAQIREELGDILWYVAAVAGQFDLDLEDIAAANLGKINDRWKPSAAGRPLFDDDYPENEQLPRNGEIAIALELDARDRTRATITLDGKPYGDKLTDASHIEDGYALHDVFHLGYAAVLGWSPVTRMLLKRKRKSVARIDEAEDGGRAIAIEEGISALVFSHAAEHDYFDGLDHVDEQVLRTIRGMVAHLEVAALRAADWEQAILTGFRAWRIVRENRGGVIEFDLIARTLEARPL